VVSTNPSADGINAGTRRYFAEQQTGPYRGGLKSDFDFSGWTGSYDGSTEGEGQSPYANDPESFGYNSGGAGDSDADVRGAAQAAFELQHAGSGTSRADQQALLNMYKGRIATKNTLAEQIAGSDRNLREQEDLLTGAAGEALGSGLKNTRENFNSRGLLYSGLRQGGEQKVKQGVAGSLSSGISGAKRDAANAKSSAQNAYAAVGLQNAQESLQLAHQAFETATRNSIARLQAMQQLGSAAGSAIGTMAGSRQQSPSAPSNQPSGSSYYDTSATGNYYDSGANDLASRTA
jgi:hypothetical protein